MSLVTREIGPNETAALAKLDDVLWAQAFLIRAFETRLLKLFAEGKLFGTVHTCIGQEFSGVAVAAHLQPDDIIFSNHRCHGHYLARTGDVPGLMAEIMGRATGICGGRGGSQHICGSGVYSNGIQGGIVPVTAGMALAARLKGTEGIGVCFIGDGTLGEGALYETMNIASCWGLPILIVLENNRYAQSTQQNETLAGDIEGRAAAFGISTWHGNTWEPATLMQVAGEAIDSVRATGSPGFLRVDTDRLMAHSKGDDNRPADELDGYWKRDAITRFTAENPELAARFTGDADAVIDKAVAIAEQAPYSEFVPETEWPTPTAWIPTVIEGKERVVSRIHEALRQAMARDSRVFLLGEDIEGPYGGAFKVTKDLSLIHPGRVRNTPISEGAIVGIANGLALGGMKPVCEIMFGDFMTLAADQWINHAAKFEWMYNGQVRVPLILRTPMGGRRGYGSTHSQCLEKHFLGLPGTNVIALHHRYDPYLLYRTLLEAAARPTLVIENKLLYGEYVTAKAPEGFTLENSAGEFPVTRLRPGAAPDVTIVCYGGMLIEAERALDRLFDEHEIVAEIICPTRIYPFDAEPVLESVRRSGRLLVAEEGQGFCGFGAEVVASVAERAGMAIQVRRLSATPNPLPCCRPAEAACLPDSASIIAACVAMVSA